MGKKESNEARMLGIIPSEGADPIPVGKIPDGATQVVASDEADNTAVVLHPVTGGKTFYLNFFAFTGSNKTGSSHNAVLAVTNSSKVIQYNIVLAFLADGEKLEMTGNFFPPLEIPATYEVTIISALTDFRLHGFIHGYEQ